MTIKRKSIILRPTISLKGMKEGDSRFFTLDGPVETRMSQETDPKTGETVEKEIRIAPVTDLETGEVGEIVVPFMVDKALAEAEAGPGFRFEMVRGATKNRTVMWTVYELE